MSDAKVVLFTGKTTLPLPPDQVLDQAKGQFTEVVVVGLHEDSELDVRASGANLPGILWLLELAKAEILKLGGDDD